MQLTIKGISTLFEKIRKNDKIKVYKIDDEADANSCPLMPQFPLIKLPAIVR